MQLASPLRGLVFFGWRDSGDSCTRLVSVVKRHQLFRVLVGQASCNTWTVACRGDHSPRYQSARKTAYF